MESFKEVCYSKTYLKQVICRIDFSPKLIDNSVLFNGEVEKAVSQYFPIIGMDTVKTYNNVKLELDAKLGQVSSVANQEKGIQRTYLSKSKKNKITIANDTITFTYNDYKTYDDLLQTVEDIVKEIWKHQKIMASRIGLRYINLYNTDLAEKKVTRQMFASKIRTLMTPSLIDTGDELVPVRNMVTSEYQKNDIKIIYRAGLYNQFYPMPISKEDYVIDIDCFSISAVDSAGEIMDFLNGAHESIQFLFEGSITDKMREEMKKSNE